MSAAKGRLPPPWDPLRLFDQRARKSMGKGCLGSRLPTPSRAIPSSPQAGKLGAFWPSSGLLGI